MLNELGFLNDTVIRDTKEYAGKKLAAKAHELTESIEKAEEEMRDSLEKTINKNKRKIQDETEKEIALREKEAFKRLVGRRDSIKDDIKKELRERLCDFTATSVYKEHIAEKYEKAKELADGETMTARVFREEDMSLFEGIKTEVAEAETAGGVIFEIPGKGIIIDNSFDTAIKTVMDNFHEISLKQTGDGQS